MTCHLHHTHLFASEINKSIQFYTEFFGGRVVMDLGMAGSRNVFLSMVGGGFTFMTRPLRIRSGGISTT